LAERDFSLFQRFFRTGDEDLLVGLDCDLGDDGFLTSRSFRRPPAAALLMLIGMLTEAWIELTYGAL
jgi:hypothetical protein